MCAESTTSSANIARGVSGRDARPAERIWADFVPHGSRSRVVGFSIRGSKHRNRNTKTIRVIA